MVLASSSQIHNSSILALDMTKSLFSFSFFFCTISLLLLLAAASARNATSGLTYEGCAPGDTIGECIKEEEGVKAVVRRILQQRRYLSYNTLQRQPICDGRIAGNCIGTVNQRGSTCTYYQRCKR